MIKVIELKSSNCYLISSEDKTGDVLVDTGSKNERKELISKIGKRKIKAVILTHVHLDSAGNAKYLEEKFKCPIYMNKSDFELLNNNFAREIYSDSFWGRIIKNKNIKKMKSEKLDVPRDINFISEGDNLDKIGLTNLRIVNLPGHTRGSIGILEDRKNLIVGDTLMNYKKPRSSLFYEEKASLLNSIEKIKDMSPLKMYPGHGKCFEYEDCFKLGQIKKRL